MRPHDQPHGLCCIDPISLAAGAAVSLASNLFGGGSNERPATPEAPPAQAAPQQAAPAKSKSTTSTPTFLGASATPQPTQSAQKSLLGQ